MASRKKKVNLGKIAFEGSDAKFWQQRNKPGLNGKLRPDNAENWKDLSKSVREQWTAAGEAVAHHLRDGIRDVLLHKSRTVLAAAIESMEHANDMFREMEGDGEEADMNEGQLVEMQRLMADLDAELGI